LTLTQVGDANFNNINIDGTLTYSNFSSDNLVGNLTSNVTGNVTGHVTGNVISYTNCGISGLDHYGILHVVNGPNISGFPSHSFKCNENLVLAINEYPVNATKPFYVQMIFMPLVLLEM
jgi:hypothetical protein